MRRLQKQEIPKLRDVWRHLKVGDVAITVGGTEIVKVTPMALVPLKWTNKVYTVNEMAHLLIEDYTETPHLRLIKGGKL